MTPRDKAQQGVQLLKEAVIDLLRTSGRPLSHAEIVNQLAIQSDFEGTGRNYLSWSVLGLLVNARQIVYEGKRNERVYRLSID